MIRGNLLFSLFNLDMVHQRPNMVFQLLKKISIIFFILLLFSRKVNTFVMTYHTTASSSTYHENTMSPSTTAIFRCWSRLRKFPFRNNIKKINDQSNFFTKLAQLIFATKFNYNGTCQLLTNSFRSSQFVSMRFTQFSKALI